MCNSFQGRKTLFVPHLHFYLLLIGLWHCVYGQTFVSSDKPKRAFNCIKRCWLIVTLRLLRYGWTSNMSTAILRHSPHENCAQNLTGLITSSSALAEDTFDAYCYDDKGDHILRKYKTSIILLLHFGSRLPFLCYWNFLVGPEKNCTEAFSNTSVHPTG